MDFAEVADDLSTVTGRPVGYQDVPPEAAQAGLLASGLPPFAAQQIVAVFAALRAGAQATTSNDVEDVTGATPRFVREFVRDNAAAFGAQPVGASGRGLT